MLIYGAPAFSEQFDKTPSSQLDISTNSFSILHFEKDQLVQAPTIVVDLKNRTLLLSEQQILISSTEGAPLPPPERDNTSCNTFDSQGNCYYVPSPLSLHAPVRRSFVLTDQQVSIYGTDGALYDTN